MEINSEITSIRFHPIKDNVCHLSKGGTGSLLIYVVHGRDADVVARPEYFIERVSVDLAVESGHNGEKYPDNLKLDIVIPLGCAITNGLNDGVYKSAFGSSFLWLWLFWVVAVTV